MVTEKIPFVPVNTKERSRLRQLTIINRAGGEPLFSCADGTLMAVGKCACLANGNMFVCGGDSEQNADEKELITRISGNFGQELHPIAYSPFFCPPVSCSLVLVLSPPNPLLLLHHFRSHSQNRSEANARREREREGSSQRHDHGGGGQK